jgi:hypothetical protein
VEVVAEGAVVEEEVVVGREPRVGAGLPTVRVSRPHARRRIARRTSFLTALARGGQGRLDRRDGDGGPLSMAFRRGVEEIGGEEL